MDKLLNELKALLYAHFDLDESSAQDYFLTCEGTFKRLEQDTCMLPVVQKALNWLRRNIYVIHNINEMTAMLQTKFQLFESPEDFNRKTPTCDFKEDFRQLKTLHVAFRKWIHWNPNTTTFYLSPEQDGMQYSYSPCVELPFSATASQCSAIFVMNFLTTVLSAGVSFNDIITNECVIERFLAEFDYIRDKETVKQTLYTVLHATNITYTDALPVSIMNDYSARLAMSNEEPVAAVSFRGTAVFTVSRPRGFKYCSVQVDLGNLMKPAMPILTMSLCEYALALAGIQSYWKRFQCNVSKDSMFLPVMYNSQNCISSFAELKSTLN